MRPRNKIALGILALAMLVLLALQTHVLTRVRGYAWAAWTRTVARVFHIGPLNLEPSLDARLDELVAENVRLKSEQQDYKIIKDQLGEPHFESFRAIPAAVAARPIDTFQSHYIINRGAASGVTLGAPVVIRGSVLVGFITELHEHTATLQLLLHPDTNLSVAIAQGRNPRGLLVGQHYTALKLTTVPRDEKLAAGQEVVTSASQSLPTGLLIGQIGPVHKSVDDAYQEATVWLSYDPDDLHAVNVLVLP